MKNLQIGKNLPLELRTAISLILKNTDYAIVAERTPRSEYTIKNLMQMKNPHEIASDEAKETAEILIGYALEKATGQIEKLQKVKSVIEKYSKKEEVAA